MRLLGLKVNESFSIVTTVHVLKVVTVVSFEFRGFSDTCKNFEDFGHM